MGVGSVHEFWRYSNFKIITSQLYATLNQLVNDLLCKKSRFTNITIHSLNNIHLYVVLCLQPSVMWSDDSMEQSLGAEKTRQEERHLQMSCKDTGIYSLFLQCKLYLIIIVLGLGKVSCLVNQPT